MTPLDYYQQEVQLGGFQQDPIQLMALRHLQRVYLQIQRQQQLRNSLIGKLAKMIKYRPSPVMGAYLWGGVGIGKTFIMDIFYDALPIKNKMRIHFHRFMKMIHDELKQLQGHKNPLELVARHLATQACIICFDEFYVADIADAMLLGNLLKSLFKQGVSFVATSNIPPDKLYFNGLQRELFLPAIDLLNQYTEVIELKIDTDYRLRALDQSGVYFYPLGFDATQHMRNCFANFSHGKGIQDKTLFVEGREIKTRRCADTVVWFNFMELCSVPRSQLDYLEIAHLYHTVLVSNIPKLSENADNLIRNFINMVDVFYDNNVTLIISAESHFDELYTAGRMVFDYERTRSRLFEMQSKDYLSRPHQLG